MRFPGTVVFNGFCIRNVRWQLFIIFCLTIVIVSGRVTSRVRCNVPDDVPNGSYVLRRYSVMRVSCTPGYTLLGPRVIDCVNGKWFGEKPVCAKRGCSTKLPSPDNGQIQIVNEHKLILFCSENYNLAGNRFAYCNGTLWDRQIGNCREKKNSIQHECDFETEDICGWVFEPSENCEWKRVMAANQFTSFLTGPRHDHTVQHTPTGGHYMLMESVGGKQNGSTHSPIPLTSPIYDQKLCQKADCCFRFYYFMYGASVGKLSVFVKPISISLDQMMAKENTYMKFTKSGNQNNIWNKAQFNFDGLSEDFQIVFMATSGRTHLSDIAIDDIHLMTGTECNDKKSKTEVQSNATNKFFATTTTEIAFYDMQSCVTRCSESSGNGFFLREGRYFGLCNCHFECAVDESCCPDFRRICLDGVFDDITTVTYKNNEEVTEEVTLPQTIQMERKDDSTASNFVFEKTTIKAIATKNINPTTQLFSKASRTPTTIVLNTSTSITPKSEVETKTTMKSIQNSSTKLTTATSAIMVSKIMPRTFAATTKSSTTENSNGGNQMIPFQTTTWIVGRNKLETKTIPNRLQTQYGIKILKSLLIILSFGFFLGTLWYCFESKLHTIFAKRNQQIYVSDSNGTFGHPIEVASVLGTKCTATLSSNNRFGAQCAKSLITLSHKSGKQKMALINGTSDTATLLWKSESEDSDESNEFDNGGLQKTFLNSTQTVL